MKAPDLLAWRGCGSLLCSCLTSGQFWLVAHEKYKARTSLRMTRLSISVDRFLNGVPDNHWVT